MSSHQRLLCRCQISGCTTTCQAAGELGSVTALSVSIVRHFGCLQTNALTDTQDVGPTALEDV